MSHFNKEDLEGLVNGAKDYTNLSQPAQEMLAAVVSQIGVKSLETPNAVKTSNAEATALKNKTNERTPG